MYPPYPHPFFEVDWRARRCEALLAHGGRPSRRDDRWVRTAWRFFRGLADEGRRQRVRRRWPHLAAAVDLRKDSDAFRRWELEAGLLAREPVSAAARRVGLTPEAVEAYVAVFFDVLQLLDATDYITLRVIGISPARIVTERDVEVWLKLFAYGGGPHVLDSLVDYYDNREVVPADIAQVEPARRARVAQQLTIRSAILAACLPEGDARTLAVQGLIERLEAQRREERLAGEVGEALPPVQLSLGSLEGLLRPANDPQAGVGRVAG